MRYRLFYGVCQLFKNKILSLVTLVMMALSFAVIEYAGIVYLTYSYPRYKAKDVIAFPYDDIYHINIQKYSTGFCGYDDIDRLINFYHSLSQIEGIKHSGLFFGSTEDNNNTLYISEALLPLCGIDAEFKATDGVSCLVGKNQSSVYPVGTKQMDLTSAFELNITSVISDATFITESFLSTGSIYDLNDFVIVSLDDMIALEKIYFVNALNNMYFIVDSSADKSRIKEDIYNLAASLEVDIYDINDIDTLFDSMTKEAYEKAGEEYLMPLVLVLCAITSMLITAYISFFKNRHDMAIMLSNNMTRRDIRAIIHIEIIIKILLAFIFSILYWAVKSIGFDEQTKEMFIMLMPWYIAGMILTNFVICLFFNGYLTKQTPLDMMGDTL